MAWPSDPEGVGSKRSQPAPWKYSSGHAWASLVRTFHRSCPIGEPSVYPTATREGISSNRASTAMAKANCWQ